MVRQGTCARRVDVAGLDVAGLFARNGQEEGGQRRPQAELPVGAGIADLSEWQHDRCGGLPIDHAEGKRAR